MRLAFRYEAGDVILIDRRPRPGWDPAHCPPWVALSTGERSANSQYLQVRHGAKLRLVDVSRVSPLLAEDLVRPG